MLQKHLRILQIGLQHTTRDNEAAPHIHQVDIALTNSLIPCHENFWPFLKIANDPAATMAFDTFKQQIRTIGNHEVEIPNGHFHWQQCVADHFRTARLVECDLQKILFGRSQWECEGLQNAL